MAEQTPRGRAIISATPATMIEPTSNGIIPYQSCQKLAVIQFVPKRKEVIVRAAGTGSSGFQARSFCAVAGNCARYFLVFSFQFSNASFAFGSFKAGGAASKLSIFPFIVLAIGGNFSSAPRKVVIAIFGSTGAEADDSPSVADETATGVPPAINDSRSASA